MHFKDGTPATVGDIFQHDDGHVGIIIGGQIGSDFCSTQVVMFKDIRARDYSGVCPAFAGVLSEADGKVVACAAVRVATESAMQTREMLKIGHVNIGHG